MNDRLDWHAEVNQIKKVEKRMKNFLHTSFAKRF
jgi:hypothetical protein